MKRAIRLAAAVLCLFTVILAAAPMAMAQNTQTLPYVLPAGGPREGLLRIVNLSGESGTVSIHAIDDAGERFGPVTLDLGANAAVHFSSRDLEQGNAARGITNGIGDGTGIWRLEFESDLDFGALAYIRTSDGFLTSMHDKVPVTDGTYHVMFFNPASNRSKQSRLRLINPGTTAAEVTISARDDAGVCATGGLVTLTLPAGASQTLTAQALEAGGEGFTGSFDDGTGKWRLFVTSSAPIEAMSLLSTATGHPANLSTVPFDASADSCRETTDSTDDHGDTRFTATVVNAPSTTAGNVEGADDMDYFRFVIPSTGALRIFTTGIGTLGFIDPDPVGLFWELQADVAYNHFNFERVDAGTCYFRIRGRRMLVDRYTLHIEFTPTD